MVDQAAIQAAGDSEGANLDVGEEVDLPQLATGLTGVAQHHQIPLREKEINYMR